MNYYARLLKIQSINESSMRSFDMHERKRKKRKKKKRKERGS
jgi:hypothetical protein